MGDINDEIQANAAQFQDRMAYIGLQIDLLEPAEHTKFNKDFKVVGKSMNMLRNVMRRKEVSQEPFEMNWKLLGCVLLLLAIIG